MGKRGNAEAAATINRVTEREILDIAHAASAAASPAGDTSALNMSEMTPEQAALLHISQQFSPLLQLCQDMRTKLTQLEVTMTAMSQEVLALKTKQ